GGGTGEDVAGGARGALYGQGRSSGWRGNLGRTRRADPLRGTARDHGVRRLASLPGGEDRLEVPVPGELEHLPIELAQTLGEHARDDDDQPVGGDAVRGDQSLELRARQQVEFALRDGDGRRRRRAI